MANMKISENFEPKYILYSIGFILCLIFVKYHWNRRWLYYHALKIPGLYPLPIIGSAHKLLIEQEGLVVFVLFFLKYIFRFISNKVGCN